jgi:hypothetical protein
MYSAVLEVEGRTGQAKVTGKLSGKKEHNLP